MKGKRIKVILGIVFIIAGFYLIKTYTYTSIKGIVMDFSGNIGLAVAIAMGLIALTFATGITLLRNT